MEPDSDRANQPLPPGGDGASRQSQPGPGGRVKLSEESEYQRQNRIWREGVESGHAHRKSGKIQPRGELETVVETFFPGDQTGQILFVLGYEWGSQISVAP